MESPVNQKTNMCVCVCVCCGVLCVCKHAY